MGDTAPKPATWPGVDEWLDAIRDARAHLTVAARIIESMTMAQLPAMSA